MDFIESPTLDAMVFPLSKQDSFDTNKVVITKTRLKKINHPGTVNFFIFVLLANIELQ